MSADWSCVRLTVADAAPPAGNALPTKTALDESGTVPPVQIVGSFQFPLEIAPVFCANAPAVVAANTSEAETICFFHRVMCFYLPVRDYRIGEFGVFVVVG